ncbi:type II toxin-antitoxin system RelE/ParE family toxin [Candidatus Woesearchaeota archaeon]|nr:type II toxin-antitoxin system RelE/ParE family toxin [Candidatus Woesearchaeota archaeon]MBI2673543.1 type II toxin-antitoxin system RelE/ParE family toxin [Candidatus Woesearchaeota archaeon]
MFILNYKPSFYEDLEKIVKDKIIRKQIIDKTLELENRAPIGKKLKGNPFWSIHVSNFRIIYEMNGSNIDFLRIVPRKHDYREI